MTCFRQLGLAEPILRAVDASGYTKPTPIQLDVVPALIAGKDVIGIAQTGTGKTAAFVLPILNRINRENRKPEPRTCGALILTPTRELASQIADGIRIYGQFMKVSSCLIVGGVKPGPQIRACAGGVDIVVATPGRLLDLMNSGAISLHGTRQVIADEADQMMDMGFLPSIRKIMQKLPDNRQTVLLSATMPGQIRQLSMSFMKDPVEISVAPVSRPIERIRQTVRMVEKPAKKAALVALLADPEITRTIVFARTKHGANKLAIHLDNAGLNALAIHGNKSQTQRDKALESFRKGNTRVLVATDVAARGIDIDDVSHVINFELPNVPETYVHRIGRTARAGRDGIAISLCDSSEIKLLRDIEKLTGQKIAASASPERERPETAEPADIPRKAKPAVKTGKGLPAKAVRKQAVYRLPRKPASMQKPGPDLPQDGLMRILGEKKSHGASPA